MEWFFNEQSDENAEVNFSEKDTINYYVSIKKELCITCNIIIEDEIKLLSEKLNQRENYLDKKSLYNIRSIICTSCLNKLSTPNILPNDDDFESLLHECLIFPEINGNQHSLKVNEISSLPENQVFSNGVMSSSVSEIRNQHLSFEEEMQYTLNEKSTTASLFCNGNKKQFHTQEDNICSSARVNTTINDSQFQHIITSIPVFKSYFTSMVRYECEICAGKYYNGYDFENHSCEQINSPNVFKKSKQGSSNANFNLDLLNTKGLFDSQSENNHIVNTDHAYETSQWTSHDIQSCSHNNLFHEDFTERVNSCNPEFDKDFISVQKVRACNDNTAAFISAGERDKHLMKPYLCHLCSKGFIRKVLLNNHIKRHSSKTLGSRKEIPKFNQVDGIYEKQKKEKRILKCDFCNKTFNSRQAFTRHLTMHQKLFPVGCFKCLTCREVFPFEQCITSHLLAGCKAQIFSDCGNLGQYEEIKIYKLLVCEYCNKGFETVDELNDHRKTHAGHYLFICAICQKEFKSYWNLRCHQRSHDYSEEYRQFFDLRKVFACQFCTLIIGSYGAFKTHLSKHLKQEKVTNQANRTLKPFKKNKNISKSIQEMKRRRCSNNKVVKMALTEDSFTAKRKKRRACKNIVIKIISSGSKPDSETKECFVGKAEENYPLNMQQLITNYPPKNLKKEINNNQYEENFNQVVIANSFSYRNNEMKEWTVDQEECILSSSPSRKQQLETNNNKREEIFQCTDFNQNHDKEQLSLICSEKATQPTSILKDHPKRRLHDCKFCSKRFKKTCNLVRHMNGTHTQDVYKK